MNMMILAHALLAQDHMLAEASKRFRQTKGVFDSSDVVVGLLLLFVTAAGFFLLSKLLEKSERAKGFYHAGKLFDELCAAHGLDRHERRLLNLLAASQSLEDAGRMFLEPERFDKSAQPDTLEKQANEISALRDRLFGDGEGSRPAPQSSVDDESAVALKTLATHG